MLLTAVQREHAQSVSQAIVSAANNPAKMCFHFCGVMAGTRRERCVVGLGYSGGSWSGQRPPLALACSARCCKRKCWPARAGSSATREGTRNSDPARFWKAITPPKRVVRAELLERLPALAEESVAPVQIPGFPDCFLQSPPPGRPALCPAGLLISGSAESPEFLTTHG